MYNTLSLLLLESEPLTNNHISLYKPHDKTWYRTSRYRVKQYYNEKTAQNYLCERIEIDATISCVQDEAEPTLNPVTAGFFSNVAKLGRTESSKR